MSLAGSLGLAPRPALGQSIPPFTLYLVTDITNLHFVPTPDAIGTMGRSNEDVVYAYQLPGTVLPGDGVYRPFVWMSAGHFGLGQGFHEITTPSGSPGFSLPAIARAINTSGKIVGQSGSVIDGDGVGTVWTLGATGAPPIAVNTVGSFGALPGSQAWSSLFDINQASNPTVVGHSSIVSDCTCTVFGEQTMTRAFSAQFTGSNNPTLNVLQMPTGGGSSFAYPVNSPFEDPLTVRSGGKSTCIESSSNNPNCQAGSAVCDPGLKGAQWLNVTTFVLMPDLSTAAGAVVRGINSSGVGVGYAYVPGTMCQPKAGVWSVPGSSTTFTQLPVVPSTDLSRAEGINNQVLPTVVGWDQTTDRAVAWTQQSNGTWTTTDLTSALHPTYGQWLIHQGHDVNNYGWIAVWAEVLVNGVAENHAALLTPIPSCHADITGNGVVDIDDLLIVLQQWGPCVPGRICSGDVNVNLTVDIDDLLAVLNGWGPACVGGPPMDVPRTVQDCLARYGNDPMRCAKCIEAIQLLNNQ